MRITASLAGLAFALGTSAVSTVATQSAPAPLLIPRGTQFVVNLPGEIRANGPRGQSAPEKVKMTVLNDVIVGGRVIARAGDAVDASQNTNVEATAGHVKTTLILDVSDVVNFCGDTIPVAAHFEQGGGTNLFFFGHSKAAVFPKNSNYVITTDRPVKGICSQKTAESSVPIPSNAATPAS